MQKLKCAVQNYEWGKVGQDSKVAQLFGGAVDSSKPYAEVSFVLQVEFIVFLVMDGHPQKWSFEAGG
jgi:mannose-6-phosphate isomerase class I